jgi:oxygen-independent coproporphyrinogen-3 oxidase
VDRGPEAEAALGPGLYVHLPFCRSRCGYCDFFTTVAPPRARRTFLHDLLREAQLVRERGVFGRTAEAGIEGDPGGNAGGAGERLAPGPPPPFRTLFLGGGTPSLLSGRACAGLLRRLRTLLPLHGEAEVTIECNPESLTPSRVAAWCGAGINRVSVGMQSADDEELRLLDRPHRFADVRSGIRRLRRAGVRNVGCDLIYGLPGGTLARWERTLEAALALEVEHISAYLLSLEPRVPLARRLAAESFSSSMASPESTAGLDAAMTLPGEDEARAQYDLLLRRMEGAGYRQYEISNFARPGYESRHNQNYWVRGDYLGLGPSSHSHRAGRRWANHASMTLYRRSLRAGTLPWASEERIEGRQVAAEWIFLGLRRLDGISWDTLASAAGEGIAEIERRVEGLERGGFLERKDGRLRLTREALFVSNAVFRELLGAL